MAQTLSVEKSLQCSTDDFYKFFQQTSHLLRQVCSEIVQKIELVPPTTSWVLTIGSRLRIFMKASPEKSENIKYEVVDVGTRKITFNVLEGPMLDLYHSFKLTLEVTAGSKAKWTIDYEKKFPAVADPYDYLNLCPPVTERVDKHIAPPGSA